MKKKKAPKHVCPALPAFPEGASLVPKREYLEDLAKKLSDLSDRISDVTLSDAEDTCQDVSRELEDLAHELEEMLEYRKPEEVKP